MAKKRYNHGYKYPEPFAPLYGKWNILRSLGKTQLTSPAQLKLEWFIFYYTIGEKRAAHTARQFGISSKTFHKWKKRFREDNLRTLEEEARTPRTKRSWMVTHVEEEQIKQLRHTYMRLGKKKLQVLYKQLYGVHISTWKIERVIALQPIPKSGRTYVGGKKTSTQQIKAKNSQYERYYTKASGVWFPLAHGYCYHLVERKKNLYPNSNRGVYPHCLCKSLFKQYLNHNSGFSQKTYACFRRKNSYYALR